MAESSLVAGPRSRWSLLDPLRILASVAVVTNHVRGHMLFGIAFGLFLFLLMMFALASSTTRIESIGSYARRKARFMGQPWLRWSLVYLVLYGLRDVLWGQSPFERWEVHMLFYGGHPFFWFLPFAIVSVVLARVLQARLRPWSPWITVPLLAALGLLSSNAALAILDRWRIPYPYFGWITGLPALPYGLALGQCLRGPDLTRRRALLALIAATSLLTYVSTPWADAPCDLARRFAVAVPLACLGFGVRPKLPTGLRALATTTFGIYLAHPFVELALLQAVDVKAWNGALHVAAVWGTSSLGVLGLRRLFPAWPEAGLGLPARGPRSLPAAPASGREAA